ncbi:hypothetical protein ABFS83_05G058200 [Erythranthe nasuta]
MASPNFFSFGNKIMFVFTFVFSFGFSQSKLDKTLFTTLSVLCDTTLHPNTCYDNLSPLIDSKNNYDTRLFYNLSVQVSINEVSRVYKTFSTDGKLTQILENTNEKILLSAMKSCRNFLSLALYNLKGSLPTSTSVLTTYETRTEFRTLLSAVGSDLNTCMDGFEYAPDEVRKVVAENLDKSTKLVTTSLAIISKIDEYMSSREPSSMVDKIEKSSELTSDSEPTWLSSKYWKLLKGRRIKVNAVVAEDGSGDYETITEAIKAVPARSKNRFVIYVKEGLYRENVNVAKEKWNVLMYGDGMDKTIVSGNRSNSLGITTTMTATFAVHGKRFIARDMGFHNTAGAGGGQAVALLSSADQSVFHRCLFDSYQDTLFTQSKRQFYRECKIYGTMDFIFGDAAVVIQNSEILVKKSPSQKTAVITAQGKDIPYSETGISIQKCTIMPAENLRGVKTYLGRPWKNYSTTVVMESHLGSFIDPKGWLPWNNGVGAPDTISYIEYNNVGPGASTAERVTWKGLSVNDTQSDAGKFTVRSFIDGDNWLPSTGVPYQADL